MYNLSDGSSAMRFKWLLALLNYALTVKASDQVLLQLKRTEQWLEDSKIDKEQIRSACKVIRAIYLEHDQKYVHVC